MMLHPHHDLVAVIRVGQFFGGDVDVLARLLGQQERGAAADEGEVTDDQVDAIRGAKLPPRTL